MHNTEFKLSEYATDTTLFIEEDQNSDIKILKILTWFKHMSGLDINTDNANQAKIGANVANVSSRGRSIPRQGKSGFKCSTSFEILGIYYDINRMGKITELNVLHIFILSRGYLQ